MGNNLSNNVRVADDFEVEAPPRLTRACHLSSDSLYFFGVQRRVVEIGDQENRLLIEGLAYRKREMAQGPEGVLSIGKLHCASFDFFFAIRRFLILASMEAAISSAVLNGP